MFELVYTSYLFSSVLSVFRSTAIILKFCRGKWAFLTQLQCPVNAPVAQENVLQVSIAPLMSLASLQKKTIMKLNENAN